MRRLTRARGARRRPNKQKSKPNNRQKIPETSSGISWGPETRFWNFLEFMRPTLMALLSSSDPESANRWSNVGPSRTQVAPKQAKKQARQPPENSRNVVWNFLAAGELTSCLATASRWRPGQQARSRLEVGESTVGPSLIVGLCQDSKRWVDQAETSQFNQLDGQSGLPLLASSGLPCWFP